MEITLHSEKQERAVFSNYPITVLGTGIQYGKTVSGALWIGKYFPIYPEDNFIVTAPTYKILSQATLPAFLKVYGNFLGEYKKGDAVYELYGGGNVYFRTNTEPDSIVGITDVRAVWGDEAGKFSLYFWENMQARAARLEAPILLTTSPYTVNWIFKDLIRPTKQGKRKDVNLISAKSIENPYFSKKIYYDHKRTMDPRRHKALYDGEFTQMQGLVYDCFDYATNMTTQTSYPVGTRFFGGIDWGYTHPFVLKVRAILPGGRQIQVKEFYKTGLILKDIKQVCKANMSLFPIELIFCDPSRPENIQELCEEGIPCVPGENNILKGIDKTYELIKTKTLLFLEGEAKYTIDELETYHWPSPEDLAVDKDDKEKKPVDASNHCLDVDRYITMGTKHLINIQQVLHDPLPAREYKDELPSEIIKRVTSRRRLGAQTEKW